MAIKKENNNVTPEKLLLNIKEFKPYFDISFKYIASLKAK